MCGKILLCFFYKGILWCSFLPAGSTPQWEGGEATATYVLQARVLFACINFLGTLRNFFSECMHVCTLAHVFVALYSCKLVCPNPLIFLPLFISLLLFPFRRVGTCGQQTTDIEVGEHRVQ